MISIPTNEKRRGWYRGQFHDVPNFTLLVPIRFAGHFTWSQLCGWGKWKQLAYVPAPRPQKVEPRVML